MNFNSQLAKWTTEECRLRKSTRFVFIYWKEKKKKKKNTNPPKPNVNTQGSFSYLPLRQCLNSNVFKMLFGDLWFDFFQSAFVLFFFFLFRRRGFFFLFLSRFCWNIANVQIRKLLRFKQFGNVILASLWSTENVYWILTEGILCLARMLRSARCSPNGLPAPHIILQQCSISSRIRQTLQANSIWTVVKSEITKTFSELSSTDLYACFFSSC